MVLKNVDIRAHYYDSLGMELPISLVIADDALAKKLEQYISITGQ
jgi:hypothetical protein